MNSEAHDVFFRLSHGLRLKSVVGFEGKVEGFVVATDAKRDAIAAFDEFAGTAKVAEVIDVAIVEFDDDVARFDSGFGGGRRGQDGDDANAFLFFFVERGEFDAEPASDFEAFLGMFADDRRGEFRERAEGVHCANFGGGVFFAMVRRDEQFLGIEVEPGPSHAVLGEVVFDSKPREHREAEHAVDFAPASPSAFMPTS